MKNEKLIERLNSILKTLDTDQQKLAERVLKDGNKYGITCMPGAAIAELILDAVNELKEDQAKAKGSAYKLQYSACKRILKRAEKLAATDYSKAVVMEDGSQAICDSYVVVSYAPGRHVRELPTHDNNAVMADHMRKIINSLEGDKTVPTPDRDKLSAYVKIQKSLHAGSRNAGKIEYCFGPGMPTVNAEYLLDVLQACPDVDSLVYSSRNSTMHSMTDAGDIIAICPVFTREDMPQTEI